MGGHSNMLRQFVAACVLFAGSGVTSAASAQDQQAVPKLKVQRPTSDFAQLPILDRPKLSPDGTAVAAKIAMQGKQYLAVIPLGGGAPSIAPTEQDLNSWQWVNNDWLVVRISGKMPYPGLGEVYVRRALGMNRAGKVVQLASPKAALYADDVIWTAHDGSPRILLASTRGIYVHEAGAWPTVSQVDISTGRSEDVVGPRQGVYDWTADGSGTVRMGIGSSIDGFKSRVLYRGGAGDGFQEIVKEGRHDKIVVPQVFLPDPTRALAIAEDANGFDSVFEYDLTKLELGKRLYGSDGFDVDGMLLNKTGDGLLGVSLNEDSGAVLWLDADVKKLEEEIDQRVNGGGASVASVSEDHQRAIVLVGSADSPGAYFLYDRKSGSLTKLAFKNEAIKLARLNPVKTIRYKARDGLEIAAILTLPKGKNRNLPLIVLPHGGPFARDSEEWDWWTQFLAERGYAVVQPNYRGSSGYGSEFAKKGQGEWGLKMQDDLNDAITYLAGEGIADASRVCIAGASYGGYAAFRAAQRDGKLYRCAISYAGVSDLERLRKYDAGFLNETAATEWLGKQAPDFKAVSPIFHPEQFSIPMLVMHGKKDERVPVSQSREMVEKLRKAGKQVKYVEQPEADHYFRRSEDRLQFLQEMEAFLKEYNPA
jgi:dipeptidyl aminopeptidase/acylaminoacyl peptidase